MTTERYRTHEELAEALTIKILGSVGYACARRDLLDALLAMPTDTLHSLCGAQGVPIVCRIKTVTRYLAKFKQESNGMIQYIVAPQETHDKKCRLGMSEDLATKFKNTSDAWVAVGQHFIDFPHVGGTSKYKVYVERRLVEEDAAE